MTYSWVTEAAEVKESVEVIETNLKGILKENLVGVYLHGSLAMGGFKAETSDIDMIVVTEKPVSIESKKELVDYFLSVSGSPFPVEIHLLNKEQLVRWQHPCPYDFHYSEAWRKRYEAEADDLLTETDLKDSDLAAHITILHRRGICLYGPPVEELFPFIPNEDYLSSIKGDYQECLVNLETNPRNSVLNMLRVYWYIKVGVITSKQEAGEWAINTLPKVVADTTRKVMEGTKPEEKELQEFKQYIEQKLEDQMNAVS